VGSSVDHASQLNVAGEWSLVLIFGSLRVRVSVRRLVVATVLRYFSSFSTDMLRLHLKIYHGSFLSKALQFVVYAIILPFKET
jgi:hypothetical protein